jgi:hypothetical protein
MTIEARNLTPAQKQILEELLGHPIAETESIHLRTLLPEPGPEWIMDFWPQSPKPALSRIRFRPYIFSPPR